MLGRSQHAIYYDPVHDEIVVPQKFGQAILTFRGGADGEEAPIRVIQGSQTQLRDSERLDVDPVHDEIFAVENDRILVYPRGGNGNVAPIRVLEGPDTQLVGAASVAVDPLHNLLIVATGGRRSRLLIFSRTDQGNVKPKSVIGGPHSGVLGIGGPFIVYPPKGEIIAPMHSPHQGPMLEDDANFVGVWSINDNGDVPPRYTIGGPNGVLKYVHGVALDVADKCVIITDKRANAVLTFYFPEMF